MTVQQLARPAAPSHIPPEFVVDFDLFGGAFYEKDLHSGLAALVAEGRDLFYTPRHGGQWIVTGRQAAFEAARDTARFSNDPRLLPGAPLEKLQIPINLDPPAHAAYRHVLVQAFSPRAVGGLAGAIRALTVELIDKVAAAGRCDFAADIAEPLPVLIFMKLMGLPLDRFAEFREWVLTGISEPDPARRQLVWDDVLSMTGPLIEARTAERADDLISRLIDADIDGRKPTFDELQSYCLMLFIAGLDTVVNAMSLAVRHLAIDQDLQARLRREPGRIPAAQEEILRRYTFTAPPRFVARDGTFYGAPLRKGDFVILMLPAADLDPRHFKQPDEVRIDREEVHMAFNSGPHRCVGAHLARLELSILYEEWLRRIPRFSLDPARPWRYHTGFVYSVDSLPLTWEPPSA